MFSSFHVFLFRLHTISLQKVKSVFLESMVYMFIPLNALQLISLSIFLGIWILLSNFFQVWLFQKELLEWPQDLKFVPCHIDNHMWVCWDRWADIHYFELCVNFHILDLATLLLLIVKLYIGSSGYHFACFQRHLMVPISILLCYNWICCIFRDHSKE